MREYKIVTDINSYFRKDNKQGIQNILVLINNYSKWWKTFKLPRRYHIKWTNETTRRKIYKLLCDSGLVSRKLDKYGEIVQNKTTGSYFKKKYYRYTVSEKLAKILKDLVKDLLHNNWLVANRSDGVDGVKKLIKKIYKNTKFHKDNFWNTLCKVMWQRLSIVKHKERGYEVVYIKRWRELMEWVVYYNMYLKR